VQVKRPVRVEPDRDEEAWFADNRLLAARACSFRDDEAAWECFN